MKKILITTLLFMMTVVPANAKATVDQVKTFFNSYVSAANNFDENIFEKYYVQNPQIIRVVEKKDGTTQAVNVPLQVYLNEAAKARKVGKLTGYKNNYTNINVIAINNDFKISAIRHPSPGGSYPAYFIIVEDGQGNLKIKVESMNTPRQEFLKK